MLVYFRNLHYAVRATLVSTEALKNRGMYSEAAMQFIKMMSEVSAYIAPYIKDSS